MGCVHQSKRFLVLNNGIEVQIIGNEKCDDFSDLLPPGPLIRLQNYICICIEQPSFPHVLRQHFAVF